MVMRSLEPPPNELYDSEDAKGGFVIGFRGL